MMATTMVGNLALHLYEVYELGLHVYGLCKKISFLLKEWVPSKSAKRNKQS